jgi:uncharacterized protein
MTVLGALGHALEEAGSMAWQIFWALGLGFLLAAVVEGFVSKATIVRWLGGHRPRDLAAATGLGAASSSCSYAAVALARSLVVKGADFTAAMVFQLASTNLVIELGLVLAVLLGWQFTLAQLVGGLVMVVFLSVAMRWFVPPRLMAEAREQAGRGLAGRMEGHAAMDMGVGGEGSVGRRLWSGPGFTAVSHLYVMNWWSVLVDVVVGLLVAGALAAWVPDTFWPRLFFTGHPLAARLWGPLIGPLISMAAFVCSIGNVPLAAVLWNGGISFGGVISFIFADLIIIPILLIERRYYGTQTALRLLGVFYLTMVLAGYVIELTFPPLGLVPATHHVAAVAPHASSVDTALGLVAAVGTLLLVARFLATGGPAMLRAMSGGPDGHDHGSHDHGSHHG